VRQIDRSEKTRPHPRVAQEANVLDGVRVDKVTHEHTAILGPALAGRYAWRPLGMPERLRELGLNDSQIDAATAEVLNRLIDPCSENALGDWVRSTALPELFGPGIARGGRDRFYRVSDVLLKFRGEIEAHLRGRYRRMFSFKRTMILYDLTNTYFEGACEGNPKARRGHSKHKRDDCPQIVVGMVFDEHGTDPRRGRVPGAQERPRAAYEPPSRGVSRRPAGRIDAHVFITILAYHLQRFLLFQLEAAGDHRSWQTVNRILATHAYTTIVLPTTKDGVTRIRKAGTPEESQKRLYDIRGIDWKILPRLVTRHQSGGATSGNSSSL